MRGMPTDKFARTLKQIRVTDREWSRYRLAKRAKISQPHIRRLEEGQADPTLGMMRKLANALGVDLLVLLGEQRPARRR
jgi:transcriptional regulator with XRE-family HTH domain